MEWFSDWWATLDIVMQVLYCIAIPGTIILLIQTVLVIAGFGGASEGIDFTDTSALDGDISTDVGDVSDGHVSGTDGGAAHDFGALSLFTLQGLVAFFCVFGWSGIVFVGSGLNTALSLLIAFVLGFLSMVGVAKIIRISGKLAQNGSLNMKILLGESGTVYIPIPEDKSVRGKVIVQLSERQVECDAVSEKGALPINTLVRVTDIRAGNVLVVEKID